MMGFYDPLWWRKSPYHSKGLAPAIEAQEPRRLAHNHSTPRVPRRPWRRGLSPGGRSSTRGLAVAIRAREGYSCHRRANPQRFTEEEIAHYRRLWQEAER
jgi:hypothetical protein